MRWALLLFVVATSVLNTVQSGSNATLQKALDRPTWTLVVVSAVSLATALVVAVASRQPLPSLAALQTAPWWAWIGGTLGMLYVMSMVLAANQLGAGLFTAVTVTVGVVTSLLMDHFAWLGFDRHPAGVGRIVGGLLMIAGLVLIARY